MLALIGHSRRAPSHSPFAAAEINVGGQTTIGAFVCRGVSVERTGPIEHPLHVTQILD